MAKSARLIPVAGPISGQAEIVITGNRAVRIGRGTEAEFSVPVDPQISTIHVSLMTNDEGLVVIDQNSTNGTFVNGRRVDKKVAFDGDEVRLGQSIWKVAIEKTTRGSSSSAFDPHKPYSPYNSPHRPQADSPYRPVAEVPRDPYSVPAQSSPARPAYSDNAPRVSGAVAGPQLELNSSDQKLMFLPSDKLTVGRTTAADIQVTDLMMSSCHFAVYCEGGKWFIADCNSTNGLFCNNVRVTKKELNSGDIVKAGQTFFDVVVKRPPPKVELSDYDQPSRPAVAPQPQGFVGDFGHQPSGPPPRPVSHDNNRLASTPATNAPQSPDPIRRTPIRSRDESEGNSVSGDAILKQLTGNEYTFALFNERNVIIGSSSQADIVVQGDRGIADKHLAIMLTTGMLVIEDLQSQAGTYVDGERVARALVQDGSVLQIGDSKFLFSLQPNEQSGPVLSIPSKVAAEPIESDEQKEQTIDEVPPQDEPEVAPALAFGEGEPDQASTKVELPIDQTIESTLISSTISATIQSQVSPEFADDLELQQAILRESDNDDNREHTLGDQAASPEEKPQQNIVEAAPEAQIDSRESTGEESMDLESAMQDSAEATIDSLAEPALSTVDSTEPSLTTDYVIPLVEPIEGDEASNINSPAHDSMVASKADFNASPESMATIMADADASSELPVEEHVVAEPIQVASASSTASVADVPASSDLVAVANLWAGYTSIDTTAIEAKKLNFANVVQYQMQVLPSGLHLYQGMAGEDDPIEICRRLLHAVPGYLVDVEPVDFWTNLGKPTQEPEDWLLGASPDDASWMIPLMTKWSKDVVFLGFTRKRDVDVKQTLLNFSSSQSQQSLMSLKPSQLVDFLSKATESQVARFFADFDAIFVELKASQLWGLFARSDFEKVFKHLYLHPKDRS